MRRRQRGRAEEGARMEGEAGHGCHVAGIAGAWRPRGECRLTRSGAARHSAGQTRELGWAERGAGER